MGLLLLSQLLYFEHNQHNSKSQKTLASSFIIIIIIIIFIMEKPKFRTLWSQADVDKGWSSEKTEIDLRKRQQALLFDRDTR